MDILIQLMIYIGSALMVLNIIQYYMFTRNMRQVGTLKIHSAIIELPFFLLIFFLVGYLLIAFLGDPSIMMAGVLFGGSIFVSLILTVMFRIIKRLSSSEQRTRTMYDELRDELTTLTQDSLATFRVNLTTDTIEDRAGMDLYESDNTAQTYTELMQNRYSDLIIKPSSDNELGLFTREGLIEHYQNGHNSAQEIVYACRKNVKNGYVMWPIRTAVSGKQVTPAGATQIMEILGKDESIRRIKAGIDLLKSNI